MDGTKLARIRCCQACPWKVIRPGGGWAWARCDAGGDTRDLDDKFMETGTCPLRRWDGLATIDLAAEAELGRLSLALRQVRELGPVLGIVLAGVADAEIKVSALDLEPEARDTILETLKREPEPQEVGKGG